MKVIHIGTNGQQSIPINQKDVSHKHARLIIEDNYLIILEDCNSKNGTFVDLHKIIRKRVTLDTVIRLGEKTAVKISQLLPPALLEIIKNKENEKVRKDFLELEPIWDTYQQKKAEIEKRKNKGSFINRLPVYITLLTGIVMAYFRGKIYAVIAVPAISFIVTSLVTRLIDKRNEKKRDLASLELIELDKQLKEVYLCPNPRCRAFLGIMPFSSLKRTGHCYRCNSKWV